MHRLTCAVCNPLARRRMAKFAAEIEAASHVEFFRLLGERARREGK